MSKMHHIDVLVVVRSHGYEVINFFNNARDYVDQIDIVLRTLHGTKRAPQIRRDSSSSI